jgi:hypothetical protein
MVHGLVNTEADMVWELHTSLFGGPKPEDRSDGYLVTWLWSLKSRILFLLAQHMYD